MPNEDEDVQSQVPANDGDDTGAVSTEEVEGKEVPEAPEDSEDSEEPTVTPEDGEGGE